MEPFEKTETSPRQTDRQTNISMKPGQITWDRQDKDQIPRKENTEDRKTQDNQRVDRWLLARSTYLWGRDKNFDSWKKEDMTLSFC